MSLCLEQRLQARDILTSSTTRSQYLKQCLQARDVDPKHDLKSSASSSHPKLGLFWLLFILTACLRPTGCLRHRSIERVSNLVFEPSFGHTVRHQSHSLVYDTQSRRKFGAVSLMLLNLSTLLAPSYRFATVLYVSARSETCDARQRIAWNKFVSRLFVPEDYLAHHS